MATQDLQAEWAWWRQVETIPELAATKFQDAIAMVERHGAPQGGWPVTRRFLLEQWCASHKPRCTCAECRELADMIEGADA